MSNRWPAAKVGRRQRKSDRPARAHQPLGKVLRCNGWRRANRPARSTPSSTGASRRTTYLGFTGQSPCFRAAPRQSLSWRSARLSRGPSSRRALTTPATCRGRRKGHPAQRPWSWPCTHFTDKHARRDVLGSTPVIRLWFALRGYSSNRQSGASAMALLHRLRDGIAPPWRLL